MKGVNLDTLPPELLRVIIRRALAGRDGSAQLAGVNLSLQDSVRVIKSDIDEVAHIMIARYGEQAPYHIYFVSDEYIRSRTPSQIVADGHAGQLLDALIAQIGVDRLDAADIVETLFRDAMIIDEVQEVVTDLWRRMDLLRRMNVHSLSYRYIAGIAICYGPIGFCVADMLPIIPISDLFDAVISNAPNTTENALSLALRKGRGQVVTYVVNRLVDDEWTDEDAVAQVRFQHAVAVAANGGGIDAFRGALVGLDASPTYPADMNVNLLNAVIYAAWSEFTQELRDIVVSLVNTLNGDLTKGVQAALNQKRQPEVLSCLLVDRRVDVSVLDFEDVTDPTVMRALIAYERAGVHRVLLEFDCEDGEPYVGDFTYTWRQYAAVARHFLKIRNMQLYAEGELYSVFPALLREWARSPGLVDMLTSDGYIAPVLMRAARDDRVEVFETWFSIPRLRDSRRTADLEEAWRVAVFVDGGKVAQCLARKGFRLPPAVARVLLESTD